MGYSGPHRNYQEDNMAIFLKPRNWRLRPDQEAFLKRESLKHDEGNASRLLRRIIDQEMNRRKKCRTKSAA